MILMAGPDNDMVTARVGPKGLRMGYVQMSQRQHSLQSHIVGALALA